MITQFILDGKTYNVQVLMLKRSFEIKEAMGSKLTQSGSIHREPIGTYYNYQMTVRERNGDREALDAFWDAISQPVASHDCTFPYNQSMLTQRMYVQKGTQDIRRLHADGAEWKDITIQFVAKMPKVMP